MPSSQNKRKGEGISSQQAKRAKPNSSGSDKVKSQQQQQAATAPRAGSPLAIEVEAGSSSGLSSPEPEHLQAQKQQEPETAQENDEPDADGEEDAAGEVDSNADGAHESSDEEPLAAGSKGTAAKGPPGAASKQRVGQKGTSAKGAGLARTNINHSNAHPTQSSKAPTARSLQAVLGQEVGDSTAAARADIAQRHADEEQAEKQRLRAQQQHQAKLDSKAVESLTAGFTVDADDISGQVRLLVSVIPDLSLKFTIRADYCQRTTGYCRRESRHHPI